MLKTRVKMTSKLKMFLIELVMCMIVHIVVKSSLLYLKLKGILVLNMVSYFFDLMAKVLKELGGGPNVWVIFKYSCQKSRGFQKIVIIGYIRDI